MEPYLYLLASFALVFALQNKAAFLRDRFWLLDDLLECTYCLGGWMGWVTWIMSWGIRKVPIYAAPDEDDYIGMFLAGTVWALASATFCYILDKVLVLLEKAGHSER